MHITRIELEDIKSHSTFEQDFLPGTTAIVGENGTGKTTIIEVIGWTLFDLLDYKKDDFVRRGAKKGVAKVTFQSGLDERRYTVIRDTKTAYYIYDPVLKTRIADKKEEVQRFLWKHLGVDSGTDLESIYRRAIGVPQGTFTAIFLESPAARKSAFDKLLKVEEYRVSADKLRETSRYIQEGIMSARERIARSEGELGRFDQLEAELNAALDEGAKYEEMIRVLQDDIGEKRRYVQLLESKAMQISDLAKKLEAIRNRVEHTKLIFSQKLREAERASAAKAIVKNFRADSLKHEKALDMLRKLESERELREKQTAELNKIENALATIIANRDRVTIELDKISKMHEKIAIIKPNAESQKEIERDLTDLRSQRKQAESIASELISIEKQVETLRTRFKENRAETKLAKERLEDAYLLAQRERRSDEIRLEIANLRARLARDEDFQKQARDGLCPILSAKCLNLKNGQTLDGYLISQFGELRERILILETEEKELVELVKVSREAEKSRSAIDTLERNSKAIEDDGKLLAARADQLRGQIGSLDEIDSKIEVFETKLKKLGDPLAKLLVFESQVQNEGSLREELADIEALQARLVGEQSEKNEAISAFKNLDDNWQNFSQIRDETREAHHQFISNRGLAESLETLQKEADDAQNLLLESEKELIATKKEFDSVADNFEVEAFDQARSALSEREKELITITANFETHQNLTAKLTEEIEKLKIVRETLTSEFREKKRLEEIGEVTDFIRTTLKESGPRVAKNYVYHISVEANQLFREISGNMERTLKWSEDYGISLEEDGFERPFLNLSGGEQMAAAMSVRLALLTQLSEIRVAFFDEPTMNMDEDRRERLAEQIERINSKGTFDQLFVISHDDTFEGYVDNVITLEI